MAWDLFFTLPNLAVPVPTPFEAEGVCLCAAYDQRLQDLADSPANDTGRRMLAEFRTSRGEVYQPACLLVDAQASSAVRDAEALRAFRNICAVATTTSGWAATIAGHQWVAQWSDHFLFNYHIAGRDGSVLTLEGPSRGIDDKLPRVQSNPAIGRPGSWSLRVDGPLCRRLLTCWRKYFVARRDRRVFRRLFRALEVAFHAGQFPGDGLTSMNDVGTRIGLWVSAFEILCHPGGAGHVNLLTVLAALNGAPLDRPGVADEHHIVTYRGRSHRVTIAGHIYRDLYNARNGFLHGNPVGKRDLRYQRSLQHLPVSDLAPVLFNVALLSYLEGKVGGGPKMPERVPRDLGRYVAEQMRRRAGVAAIQTALIAARYTLDQYGRPRLPVRKRGRT